MDLKERLKEATLEGLKQVSIGITPYKIALDTYAEKNGGTLKSLRNQGIIDDAAIDTALEVAVFEHAELLFQVLAVKRDIPYADHVLRPECLAYAMQKGKFTDEQTRKIPFDHGGSKVFLKEYGQENLLSVLREELLNPKPLPKISSDELFDPHP